MKTKNILSIRRPLSQQFINALKQAGYEIIFVNDNDSPKNIMEKVLTWS